jgi:hypothetical protein
LCTKTIKAYVKNNSGQGHQNLYNFITKEVSKIIIAGCGGVAQAVE